jgi:hypothetical protein
MLINKKNPPKYDPPLQGPEQIYEVEAIGYFEDYEKAIGAQLPLFHKDAFNQMVKDLKAFDLWNRMEVVYPFGISDVPLLKPTKNENVIIVTNHDPDLLLPKSDQ